MLKVKKNIKLTGESLIEATAVEGYSAEIDSENPENISISNWHTPQRLTVRTRKISVSATGRSTKTFTRRIAPSACRITLHLWTKRMRCRMRC